MDRDPSLTKVTFDLPKQHVPELMAQLGGFAMEHGISLDIAEAYTSAVASSLLEDGTSFVPERMALMPDVDGSMVPTVTRTNLSEFAKEIQRVGLAGRLINGLGRAARGNDSVLRSMLVLSQGEFGFKMSGIRVDRFNLLVKQLESRDIKIIKVGNASIEFLREYGKVLFP